MPSPPNQQRHFDGIQYLRGIAAVMVVAHHARHYFGEVAGWTTFGSRGVDIFFVISGFIMVHATRSFDTSSNTGRQAIGFLVKRAIRVVPLYWLALIYLNKRVIWEGNAPRGLWQDFLFIPRFNPETPSEIWPSLVPGWTINFEIEFYVLFGLALWFGSRRYLALTLAICALMVAGAAHSFATAPAIFWTSSVIGEFLLGMGVFWVLGNLRFVPSASLAALALGIGLLGLSIVLPGVPRVLVHGPFAALIVWAGVHLARTVRHQSWLSLLGDASYSLYLSHLFTFVISIKLCNALQLHDRSAMNIVAVLLIHLAIAIPVGVLVHRLVEKPLLSFMQGRWERLMKPRLAPA